MHSKLVLMFIMVIMIVNTVGNVYAATNLDLPTFAVVEASADKEESVETVKNVAKPAAAEASFNFQSKSQILMEISTGRVIYENNAEEKAYPASVTKIMTLLLIMEAIDSGKISYDDKVVCSENASKMGGSQIWFQPGEELTIDEALKCICVVSANDVCVAMAEHIGGNEENFVKMMNDKAKELGMSGTNFVNCHGIDDPNHYTTAKDIGLMSCELMKNHPDITKYTTIWMDSIRSGTFGLSNTNKLIRYYDGATGLKTGYTSTAMYNLSATAKKNDMDLVAVILTAPSSDIRNEEAKQLLNYGFANFNVQKLCKKDEVIDKIKVNKYLNNEVEVVLENDVTLLEEKGATQDYDKKINIDKKITAPLKKGDKVGDVVYTDKDGIEVGKTNIIVKEDIKKSGVLEYIKHSLKMFMMGMEIL